MLQAERDPLLPKFAQPMYHGSCERLPVGTILVPQPDYETRWGHTDFYHRLERYRPAHLLAHKDAVFLCDNADDVDNAGGGSPWLFTVTLQSNRIERHAVNWGSEVGCLISDLADEDAIRRAAENYWSGATSEDEVVWEYLVPCARIIAVERY